MRARVCVHRSRRKARIAVMSACYIAKSEWFQLRHDTMRGGSKKEGESPKVKQDCGVSCVLKRCWGGKVRKNELPV